METNMTIEEFNKEVSKKVLANFERYDNGIIKRIDKIRVRMCNSMMDFIRGLNEETDEVFMLVEYHSLMKEVVARMRCVCSDGEVVINILDLLKEIKEHHINDLLRLNVKFNSTSVMHNMRKLRKVEAYQQLIGIVDQQIKECVRLFKVRYEKM